MKTLVTFATVENSFIGGDGSLQDLQFGLRHAKDGGGESQGREGNASSSRGLARALNNVGSVAGKCK
jgi:hypothetical protein